MIDLCEHAEDEVIYARFEVALHGFPRMKLRELTYDMEIALKADTGAIAVEIEIMEHA